jgi:ankyrin repeat protein
MEGHTDIVKALLAHGADVNAKEDRGRTALIYAVYNGHTDIVKALLKEGADVDVKNKDITALMIAAYNGHTDIVKALLKEGAHVDVKDNDGLTALMIAASIGYTETVKVLLDNGDDVNIKFQGGSKALKEDVTEDSIHTAGHLMSMLNIQSTELNKDFFRVNRIIETIRKNLNIIKIKVFSPSGEVIYSTEPKDIGIINKNEYFHEIVARGKNYAKVVQKDTQSLEDQLMKSDVVETYVPIMDADRFLGAFEIYYDITDRKDYTADLQPL